MLLYHVTPAVNALSIQDSGLIPNIGPRAQMVPEEKPLIYFFPDRQTAEEALCSWMGDCFCDEEELVLLKVDIPDELMAHLHKAPNVGYEVTCDISIPPQCIISYERI